MAIYRGTGGSIVGVDQADSFIVSVGQGGTGADNVTDARTNLGLGSAAIKDETYFATAAQGALADTSVQTSDIGVTVLAPNGSAASLTGFPTFNQDTTGTAANVTGVVAIANGGTGQTTAVAARAALLPSYATNGGKILAVKADASDIEYIEVSGTGTVTSVGMSVPTGLSVSGSPVTTTGTLAVTYSAGYAIPTTAKQTEWDTAYTDRNKWDGGSTGLDAATGRTSLGLGTAATTAATDYATAAQGAKADSALQSSAIGVSIQGYDADTTKNDVANTFTANQVVEVTDNTNAALRITQLGTGNALLVEDSSNPDSTPFVIDSGGKVGIGISAPLVKTQIDIGATSGEALRLSCTVDAATQQTVSLGFATSGANTNPAALIEMLEFDASDSRADLVFYTRGANSDTAPTEAIRLTSGQGLTISRTAVTSPASTDGNVFSGSYTPTITNVTNVAASTASVLQYMRVGSYVQISGRLQIDPTTTGTTTVRVSLPVASNFSSVIQAGGTFCGSSGEVGYITAVAATDDLQFQYTATSTANNAFYFSLGYWVL